MKLDKIKRVVVPKISNSPEGPISLRPRYKVE